MCIRCAHIYISTHIYTYKDIKLYIYIYIYRVKEEIARNTLLIENP